MQPDDPLYNPSVFIGRVNDITEIEQRLLNPHCRLLTLAGVGGCGKTQLATKVLTKVTPHFNDGVFSVSLINITSFEGLITAIISALDIQLHAKSPPQEQLINTLKKQSILIVLDNFEQLVNDKCKQFLIGLLQQTTALKLLLTSRVKLNIHEIEWNYPLSGLSCPQKNILESLQTYDAITLVQQECLRRGVNLDIDKNKDSLLRICEITRGLPLAIKLAMGWIQIYTLAEISQQLETNLDLFHKQQGDPNDPHYNIRVVFETTWQLLSFEEQNIYMQLAVFKGGFTVETAKAVTNVDEDMLMALKDKSLIENISSGQSPTRYDLHPLLRQFGFEKLKTKSTLCAKVTQNHAIYFLEFLGQHEAQLQGPDLPSALATLAIEAKNTLVAWHWAIDNSDINKLAPAVYSFVLYYSAIGAFNTLGTELNRAKIIFDRKENLSSFETVTLAWILSQHAGLIQNTNPHEAIRVVDQSIALHESVGVSNQHALAFAYLMRGAIHNVIQKHKTADKDLEKSVSLYRSDGNDMFGQWFSFAQWGDVKYELGDYKQSLILLREGLDLAEQQQSILGRSFIIHWFGRTLVALNRLEEARAHFQEASLILKTMPMVLPLSWYLMSIARFFEAIEQPQLSIEILKIFIMWDYGLFNDIKESKQELDRLLKTYHQLDSDILHEKALSWFTDDHLHGAKFGLKTDLLDYIVVQLDAFDLDKFENAKKIPVFTEREQEVLQLMCNHMPNKAIAKKLFVAEGTIKSHISEIFYKFGLRDKQNRKRSRAITIAKELGLCD